MHLSSSLSSFCFDMKLFLSLLLIVMVPFNHAEGPPSPGYYPSSKFSSLGFNEGFRNLWGPQHQSVDQGSLTIWLDSSSGPVNQHHCSIYIYRLCNSDMVLKSFSPYMETGSGFKSLTRYRSGYFGAAIKLQAGYTAGVITSFYVRTP